MTIDDQQNNLLARLDERQKAMDSKIDAILEQTTKTNGRLTKAEGEIQNLNLWKSQLKGGYTVLIGVGSVLFALIGWIISKI
jgi:prefoldin subunit 5